MDLHLSLDDLRLHSQRRWDRDSESLRGLQVDDQLEFRGLLDRKLGGPGAAEHAVNVGCTPPVELGEVGPIGHQASDLDIATVSGHAWKLQAQRRFGNDLAIEPDPDI